ncbi:MAG: hypothetical protein MUC50_18340, partial [Myxococcota bacterium]|nr:hypothetical protein [Myxococcota bacterium]
MRRNSPIHSALQSTIFVPCLFLGLALDTASGAALAQAAAPPPPPPGALATAVPATAAKTEAKGGTTPSDKEKEVLADLESGAAALGQLDIAAAQGYFEQAFARCDAAALKGPILAKVYMALGSLYAGYLQQLPQGTEFLKLAFQSDPNVKTLPEATNSQVLTAVQMVKEKLGLATTAKAEPQGPPATNAFGGFWVVKHQRVSSAKRLYPLGLWVETNPMVAVNGVRLYFRIPSDRVFTVGMMQKKGNQWGLLIDCSAIALLDPTKLFYYYEVLGGDGSVIAHEGTASEPMEIEMFKEGAFQGQQPMLPGMPEPKQCNPDDAAPCPPWEPHCKDVACVGNEDCVTG